jgi:tetratricopeptide (TPR) repeat protein
LQRFKIWLSIGAAFAVVAVAAALLHRGEESQPPADDTGVDSASREVDGRVNGYAGSASCRACHEDQHARWSTSHHALAERPFEAAVDHVAFTPPRAVAHGSLHSEVSVVEGEAQILTVGPDGDRVPFRPDRVIGVAPLIQYVLPFSRGRYQVASLSYDPARNDWFDVFGDEDRRHHEWGFWANRGMTWNSMCAGCHTTNLRKKYDFTTDSYATTWNELGVGCEACHGPYADHVAWYQGHEKDVLWPGRRTRTPDEILGNCGSCHARRVELTTGFVPGEPFLDHFRPVLPDEGEIYYPDGQVHEEDFEYSSFILSRMHGEGVRCIHCHTPHSAKPRLEGNALCLSCHKGKVDPGPHSHHDPAAAGGQCTGCHMPQTTYMQRHPRRDHAFTIPDPLLTREFGIPNACNRCHEDKSVDWAIAAVETWFGKRMERGTRRRARVVARARRGDETAIPDLLAHAASERSVAWRAVMGGLLARWLDHPEVLAYFVEWLEHSEALLRGVAVRALEPVQQLAPRLRPLLEDERRLVRLEAAWALRRELDISSRVGKELEVSMNQSADQPGGALQWGRFYLDRGRARKAVAWMRRAAGWDPATAEHRGALAVALQENGQVEEAILALKEAEQLAPDNAQWPFALGLAYAEGQQLEMAIAGLEKACALDPTFGRAWYNLALAQSQSGQTDAALASLRRAEEEEPGAVEYPFARATVHRDRGEIQAAQEAALRALQLAPESHEARRLLESLRAAE